MQTPNQGESVDSAASQVPQKVGAISGGFKTKIMAIFAALGLAASVKEVDGAITLSYANPTLLAGSSSNVLLERAGGNTFDRLRTPSGNPGTINMPYEGTARFTITVPTSGMLTVSWNSVIGTGEAPGDLSVSGFANTDYYIDQRANFGLNSGPINEINFFEGDPVPDVNNDTLAGLNGSELFNYSFNVAKNIFVTPGTYNFDVRLEAMNTTSFSDIKNVDFSLDTTIPEPSTGILVGTGALALLHRRREGKKKK